MKIYSIIIGYLILFAIGGMCGWILELFFRRIVHKKWINPGFLNGPFIPLYGFGVVILYFISDLSIAWYYKAILFLVLLTLIEYIAGIIFIKGMHIKLWDYSSRWGNIQGIICPLFSIIWAVIGVAFLFTLYQPFKNIFIWTENNLSFSFFLGIIYGILFIDFCISMKVSVRLRSLAKKAQEVLPFEKLKEYLSKLNEYVEKIQICGDGRNSYSKTDHSATFMRIKKDYMGNDQLLPAYNVQVGVADEYIAVVDVNQYRSDMDCFIPLMNKFHDIYGFYPKYPVADAGYGSYNNYIFCEQNGLEKYMKFPMFKKETTDRNYHEDPFRAVNFKIDGDGKMRCPNGKGFHLQYRKAIKGNAYGREEEIYQCEDCSGCPYAEKCKKEKETVPCVSIRN